MTPMSIVFASLFWLLVLAPLLVCLARIGRLASGWVARLAAVSTIAGLAAGASVAVTVWSRGGELLLDLTPWSPFTFVIGVDRLSSFFLLLICAVAIPVVAYSVPYVKHHYGPAKTAWYWALLPLFLLSMVMVVTGASAFAFFLGWELMTLFSTALILLEGDSPARRRSIFVYLLMMHAGAALVLSAFLLFAPYAPSLDFAGIRAASGTVPDSLKAAVFVLAFVGFGTKAGIIPLHVWLPKAHPIAPTPVSALMSAVMLKTAVYAFLRFVFDFLSGGPAWGGYVVIAAGAISSVLGILYAIFETDLKRLLAYSSVENVGISYLVFGASLLAARSGAPVIAALLLVAALVHCLNHAIFKSLLFLGAGAIHYRTHTYNMNELGGLQKRMPVTGLLFLAGSLSIAGLPLFSGFVGEWIAFQGFLAGAQLPTAKAQVVLPLLAGVLALTGGLAAACFVNVYGSVFLGRPRTAAAGPVEDAPRSMLLPLGVLATACVIIGLAPAVLLRPVWLLTSTLIPGADFSSIAAVSGGITSLALVVLLAIGLTALLNSKIRTSAIWSCGLTGLTTRMQYTASCFSKPVRMVFARAYRADRKLHVVPADERYFPVSISYESKRTTSYEKTLYRPLFDSILGAAQQLRRLQTGNIQLYLLYIFVALLSMLLMMRFW